MLEGLPRQCGCNVGPLTQSPSASPSAHPGWPHLRKCCKAAAGAGWGAAARARVAAVGAVTGAVAGVTRAVAGVTGAAVTDVAVVAKAGAGVETAEVGGAAWAEVAGEARTAGTLRGVCGASGHAAATQLRFTPASHALGAARPLPTARRHLWAHVCSPAHAPRRSRRHSFV